MRLFNPEVFQGNLKKKNYFEGWYFKHVSRDLAHVLSFIPGISLTREDPHAFIQILDGITGKSEYIRYSLNECRFDRKSLYLKIGSSEFTRDSAAINIKNNTTTVTGQIDYQNIIKYPKSLLSPGIMGWYSFVPFMECKHDIISVYHSLKGQISVNGNLIDFTNGTGYIEKDWGVSFPEAWIWIQSNNFDKPGITFSFSVAKIPWLGKFFMGHIAFLYLNNRFILFSTYNKSILSGVIQKGAITELTLENRLHILKVRVERKSTGELRAPVTGEMSRRIKESIDSDVYLELYDKMQNLLFKGKGRRAGVEIIDKIFEYL